MLCALQEVPKACDNFMNHLTCGYYRNTIFHRLVKHFVLQGGDPTGTGVGGQSSFPGGEAFEDEFKVSSITFQHFHSIANNCKGYYLRHIYNMPAKSLATCLFYLYLPVALFCRITQF